MSSPFLSWRTDAAAGNAGITELLDAITGGDLPLRLSAYDGSRSGPHDAPLGMHITRPRGISYLASAPGPLGLARAYVSGDLTVDGVHPADPYPLLRVLQDRLEVQRPDPGTLARIVRTVGVLRLVPPPPPPQEALPDWRRALEGLRHSRRRDAEAISHHYDVSNRFYEMLLGAVDDLHLRLLPDGGRDAWRRPRRQVRPGRPQARAAARGCGCSTSAAAGAGWCGTPCSTTGSRRSASRCPGSRPAGAQAGSRPGAGRRPRCGTGDYRDVTETGFDAVSSIGLTEHIGVRNYPAYFGFLRDRLRPGGRLLNHCITRPDNRHVARVRRGFIDRYVFPDGELTGVRPDHHRRSRTPGWRCGTRRTCASTTPAPAPPGAHNLRRALGRLRGRGRRGDGARCGGCTSPARRLGFERNQIQLHQVLAVKPDADGDSAFPLRPDWGS